jgi:hypothetical protein
MQTAILLVGRFVLEPISGWSKIEDNPKIFEVSKVFCSRNLQQLYNVHVLWVGTGQALCKFLSKPKEA